MGRQKQNQNRLRNPIHKILLQIHSTTTLKRNNGRDNGDRKGARRGIRAIKNVRSGVRNPTVADFAIVQNEVYKKFSCQGILDNSK